MEPGAQLADDALEPPPPDESPRVLSWLRDEDAALAEEDAEKNAEQAERNLKVRTMLRGRKLQDVEQVAPEEFMSCAAPKPSDPKPGVSEDQPPWLVVRPYLENTVLRLHEELLDFAQFMKHTREEVVARRKWVRTIGNSCRALWPDCQVRVFGSFFTGLCLPNGDVDVAVLDVPCKPATAMKILADHMLGKGEISWLEIIESAKVPVVKLRSQASGLRADVVFNQEDGLNTSRFTRARLKEFPQMRPLLLFLKYFLLQRGLHETYTGGMGSYLLANVVLHFVQRHPARRNPRQYSATSLGHYLFDFLKYYSQEFRFDSQGISVVDGGYTFNKGDRGWQMSARGGKLQLCLESPNNPSVDLGGPCFRMAVLRNLFHHGFHCLCHLFVTRSPPEVSMLCPLLLDPAHPVIADRYRLMAEQPVALPGLPRTADRGKDDAAGGVSAEDFNYVESEADEPPRKRGRLDAGGGFGGIDAGDI